MSGPQFYAEQSVTNDRELLRLQPHRGSPHRNGNDHRHRSVCDDRWHGDPRLVASRIARADPMVLDSNPLTCHDLHIA